MNSPKFSPLILFLVLLAFTRWLAPALQADMTDGQIKAIKVKGIVTRSNPNTRESQIVYEGSMLQPHDTIETSKEGSLMLLFSNGSAVAVAEDTRLSIEKFLQTPYPTNLKIETGAPEPSTSQTVLSLDYGDIIGTVNKLNIEQGSSYTIKNPVATAGIRGTDYEILSPRTDVNAPVIFQVKDGDGFITPINTTTSIVVNNSKGINVFNDSTFYNSQIVKADNFNSITNQLQQALTLVGTFDNITGQVGPNLNLNNIAKEDIENRDVTQPEDGSAQTPSIIVSPDAASSAP